MPLDFSLLGQGPQFGNVLQAYQMGRETRKASDTQNALKLYAQDPEAGISALTAVDPLTGMKLRADYTAQKKETQRQAVFAQTDPKKRQAAALATADPATIEAVQKMDETQLKHTHELMDAMGGTAYGILQKAPDDSPQSIATRRELLTGAAPHLVQLGIPQDQIDKLLDKPTTANLQGLMTGALTTQQQIEKAQKEREFDLSRMDKEADNKRADALTGETMRHNKESEGTARMSAGAAAMNARTNASRLSEDMAGGGGLDPSSLDYVANQYRITGQLPALGMGKAAVATRTAIINRASELDGKAGVTGADAVANHAGAKANSAALSQVSKQKNMIQSFESTASKNGDLMLSLAPKGAGPSGSPTLNRWIQAGRKQIAGDPDVSNFDIALGTFADEYAKVVTGGTGSQAVTDSARREAYDRLSKYATKGQLQGGVATMKKEMANRIGSLNEQEAGLRQSLSGRQAPAAAAPAAAAQRPPLSQIFK